MLAALVVAPAVSVPRCLVHEVLEPLPVRVRDEVARPLPALGVVRRIAPGCAGQVAVALQELRVCRGRVHSEPAEQGIDIPELVLDLLARQENLAAVHRRVSVGRRKHVAVDVELPQVLEQLGDLGHIGFSIDRRIRTDHVAGRLGGADAFHGRVEDALALHAEVVRLPQAVEVNVEDEAFVRLEFVQPIREEHAVRAEIDMSLARQGTFDQPGDRLVHQGLPATDRDYRRAAFVDGVQAGLQREPLGDGLLVFSDSTAPRAGQIAGVQGLEHQHQGKSLAQQGVRRGGVRPRLAGVGEDWKRRFRRSRVPLPLGRREKRVSSDVRSHPQRARQRKPHRSPPRAYSPSAISGKYCGYMW